MEVVPLYKLLLDWADELLSKKVGVDWSGWTVDTPFTVMTTLH